eukprot:2325928-Prymnesium_polylepis.1
MHLEKEPRGMTSLRLRAELLLAPAEDSGWIHLPTTEYQVPLSFSVEELTTALLAEVSTSSSVNIKPEQCLYLFLNLWASGCIVYTAGNRCEGWHGCVPYIT